MYLNWSIGPLETLSVDTPRESLTTNLGVNSTHRTFRHIRVGPNPWSYDDCTTNPAESVTCVLLKSRNRWPSSSDWEPELGGHTWIRVDTKLTPRWRTDIVDSHRPHDRPQEMGRGRTRGSEPVGPVIDGNDVRDSVHGPSGSSY